MFCSQPTEYMTIEETYMPGLHRINQAIRTRAVQPDKPIEDPPEVLVKWSHPPSELVKKSAPKLQKLVEAADVKKGNFTLQYRHPRHIF